MRCIHHAKRSWNATAAYATGERRADSIGMRARHRTPVSQCHSQMPNCWQRCRKTGRIRTTRSPILVNWAGGSFYAERRCRHRSARRSPSVRPGAPSICIRAARSRAFWRPVCVLRARREACDFNSASVTSSVEPCDKISAFVPITMPHFRARPRIGRTTYRCSRRVSTLHTAHHASCEVRITTVAPKTSRAWFRRGVRTRRTSLNEA